MREPGFAEAAPRRAGFPWVLVAGAFLLGAPAPGGQPARVSLWAAEVPTSEVVAWRGKPVAEWFEAARVEVAADRAEEATMLVLSGKLGGKMTIESIREVIYPTEYDPEDWRWRSTTVGLNESRFPGRVGVPPPFLYPIPTWSGLAFETRNLGETVEAEVTGGRLPGTLHLRLAAEWLRQDGDSVYLERGQDDGGKWRLAFPCFVNRRILGSFECPRGNWMLVGAVDPWRETAKAGSTALVFVRVESQVVEADE